MLGTRNGPRMDEDPVGPCHRVAGGLVGYKHGMRDGMGPQASPGEYAGAPAQGKGTGAGRERPVLSVQCARATGLQATRWGIYTG